MNSPTNSRPVPITISKEGGDPVDARSILAVIGLDARGGDEVVLRAEGPEADEVPRELSEFVAANHDSNN